MKLRRSDISDFELLFDNVSNGVAIYEATKDGADFVIVDINPAGAALSRVKREEIIGKSVAEVFPGVKQMGLFEVLQRVYRTGATEYLPLCEYRDGRLHEWVKNTVYKSPTGHVVALYEDVTRTEKAKEAVLESELLHEAIVNSVPDLLWLKDTDGRFVSCNSAFERYVGAKRSDIVGKTDFDFFDKERAEFFREKDKFTIRADKAQTNQEWLVFSDSGYQGLFETIKTPMRDSRNRLRGVLGIARDITALSKANEELKEMAALLRAAMNCSPAGIAIADVPSGTLRYVNPAGLGIRGRPEEEVVTGVDLKKYVESWQIRDFDGRPLSEEEVPLARAVLYGEECNRQFVIRRENEGDRIVWAHAAPVRDEDGEIIAAIVIFPDITDLKKAEEENLQLQEHLQQSHRLEAVGRLAGGVAHDFNNMLTVISGNVSLALGVLGEDSDAGKPLKEIEEAVARAANLTSQLLTFSRKQEIHLQVIDPVDLLDGVHALLIRTIGETIELTLRTGRKLSPIKIDRTQVEQVLINLAINARDAMPRGGELTIAADTVELNRKGSLPSADLEPGSYLRIAVSDTGHGIPEDRIGKVFDPFFTSKGEGKGFGLGLASAFGTMRQHGGTIEVSSDLGKGSTFSLYFPTVDEEPVKETAGEAPIEKIQERRRILVVEDEPQVRNIVVRVLERMGHSVFSAESGVEALKLVESEDLEIELLLTDVVMPNMSGYELAEKLIEKDPSLAVLFTSGYSAEKMDPSDFGARDVQFLGKPYSPTALSEKVRKMFDSKDQDSDP